MAPNGQKLMLLVDAEPAQQRLVAALAARAGWRTIIAADGETAIATLGTRDGMMLDAILIDQAIPGSDVGELIGELRARRPALPVITLSAISSFAVAADALRAGATDFLIKPLAPERLLWALEQVAGPHAAQGELRPLTEKLPSSLGFGAIAGSDPEFRAALAIAAKAARARLPVLIEGEPGTGKQMVAEAIHAASSREKRNLVIVNGSALAPNLLESELFGHEPGAFAGAFTRQTGKLVTADGGTVLIDEVGTLPLDVQTKLLHFIDTGEVRAMGARTARHVDVRIVATSSRPLLTETQTGQMREDLYFKLAMVHVTLPPLRDRAADIAPIARHLMGRIGTQPGMQEIGITDDALALLSSWDWPGNVRQLHSTLFRAAIACQGSALTAIDFPQIAAVTSRANRPARANEAGVTLYRSDGHMRELAAIEADVIRLAIGHYRGRMTEVARRLGIGRSTLYRKLAELGISDVA